VSNTPWQIVGSSELGEEVEGRPRSANRQSEETRQALEGVGAVETAVVDREGGEPVLP